MNLRQAEDVAIREAAAGTGGARDGEAAQSCSRCPRGTFCLPTGLTLPDAQRLDALLYLTRPLQAGQSLFRAGEPFKAVYAVRSGAFKTATIDCDGREQIVGFHLPGELLGLDGMFAGRHECSAVALTASRACLFDYRQLLGLAAGFTPLMERLLKLLGKDIVGGIAAVGDYLADERLAALLLGLSLRLPPRGEPKIEFTLPMPLSDIANHLRLAGATLSRTLGRLQEDGLIALKRRRVQILDFKRLRHLARRVPTVNL